MERKGLKWRVTFLGRDTQAQDKYLESCGHFRVLWCSNTLPVLWKLYFIVYSQGVCLCMCVCLHAYMYACIYVFRHPNVVCCMPSLYLLIGRPCLFGFLEHVVRDILSSCQLCWQNDLNGCDLRCCMSVWVSVCWWGVGMSKGILCMACKTDWSRW